MTDHSPAPAPAAAATLAARLDRLPWSRTHTAILLALGAGWLFDSLEVSLFGSAVGPLGSHFHATVFEQDAILAVWLGGILIGALAGGHLADRYGRRRLFVLTLLWYAAFTVLTGASWALGVVYVLRFLAALGVGAEYAIINAAVAELMPARIRGRAGAVVMNFWPAGGVLAGLLAYLLLNTLALSDAVSWRCLFIGGGLLAPVVLWFRRHVPESPRWLAARGRRAEAEAIVAGLERACGLPPLEAAAGGRGAYGQGTDGRGDDGPELRPGGLAALGELVRHHPGRLALGAVLDLAEAFGYYGIFALLSVVVLPKVHIADAQVPFFYILGNLGALIGGLVMALFLDRLGRHRTVAVSYLLAAAGVGLLAWATASGSGTWVTLAFMAASGFATAAWTSAYPTFTELFPTHLRAAGVGTSVAVGRIGAIVGTLSLPSLATHLGATASYLLVVAFWLVGAAAVAVFHRRGGIEAAGRPLETLTRPAHLPARA
ncbi:MFS transporter [Actinacidiphila acididurans]|uniref:MFS transporter n=1 Tax=Actinacidiphila acididurans TaxID=2784346 RepID=A0ABS2TVC8_9ACTN|nr:MFS transporter [Actinacidiphila acididurans]MBM9506255.1 MFS transporter [Actinacidiphila acididurans]